MLTGQRKRLKYRESFPISRELRHTLNKLLLPGTSTAATEID